MYLFKIAVYAHRKVGIGGDPAEVETNAMRYRSDSSTIQKDGAVAWYANWMGGPTLAKIEHCRLANLVGDMRRTVTITGEADTAFSIPAVCSIAGETVKGYVTGDGEGNFVFRHVYY